MGHSYILLYIMGLDLMGLDILGLIQNKYLCTTGDPRLCSYEFLNGRNNLGNADRYVQNPILATLVSIKLASCSNIHKAALPHSPFFP